MKPIDILNSYQMKNFNKKDLVRQYEVKIEKLLSNQTKTINNVIGVFLLHCNIQFIKKEVLQ